LLANFSCAGRYWMASGQEQRGQKRRECAKGVSACSLPEGVFIDAKPLVQVLSNDDVEAGRF
jgi:hypothetical protein